MVSEAIAALLTIAALLGLSSAASSSGPLPSIVAYFVSVSECPPGWQHYDPLDGRVAVPVADSSSGVAGIVFGAPLPGDGEPLHDHGGAVKLSSTLPDKCISATGCGGGGNKWLLADEISFQASLEAASAQVPLVRLLTCALDANDRVNNAGFSLPSGSIVFFDPGYMPKCRSDWTGEWAPLPLNYVGRPIVPFSVGTTTLSLTPPIVPGPSTPLIAPHQHGITGSASGQSHDSHNLASLCNCYSIATSDPQFASGTLDSDDGGGLPYMSLMACQAVGDPGARGVTPAALVVFTDAQTCRTDLGWAPAPLPQEGSFIVSLHEGGTQGASGAPMASGDSGWAVPPHSHVAPQPAQVQGQASAFDSGIVTSTDNWASCCAITFTQPTVEPISVGAPPYVQLRACMGPTPSATATASATSSATASSTASASATATGTVTESATMTPTRSLTSTASANSTAPARAEARTADSFPVGLSVGLGLPAAIALLSYCIYVLWRRRKTDGAQFFGYRALSGIGYVSPASPRAQEPLLAGENMDAAHGHRPSAPPAPQHPEANAHRNRLNNVNLNAPLNVD